MLLHAATHLTRTLARAPRSCASNLLCASTLGHAHGRSLLPGTAATAGRRRAMATSAADAVVLTAEEKEGIASAIAETNARAQAAVDAAKAKGTYTREPRLVAVSKTKPIEAVFAAYAAGQRHFGENYVQELVGKANHPDVPADIQWHFIGTLQSNKVKHVAALEQVAVIETITSIKLANAVNKVAGGREGAKVMDVFVQINTSGEENKGGIAPDESASLVKHIMDSCPHINFAGLMTIGEYGRVIKPGETNPDFEKLAECRTALAAELNLAANDIELSMGMSGDFEHAIELGSTNVRVGSTIFGARNYNK